MNYYYKISDPDSLAPYVVSPFFIANKVNRKLFEMKQQLVSRINHITSISRNCYIILNYKKSQCHCLKKLSEITGNMFWDAYIKGMLNNCSELEIIRSSMCN